MRTPGDLRFGGRGGFGSYKHYEQNIYSDWQEQIKGGGRID